jgi:hypothetical protein
MTLKIEKDIPVPQLMTKPVSGLYHKMEVGDSIFIPKGARDIGVLRAYASGWKKATGFSFSTRKVTENGVVGVRIWRVADEPKLRAVK